MKTFPVAHGFGWSLATYDDRVSGHGHIDVRRIDAGNFQRQNQIVIVGVQIHGRKLALAESAVGPCPRKHAAHFVLQLSNLAPRIPDPPAKTTQKVHVSTPVSGPIIWVITRPRSRATAFRLIAKRVPDCDKALLPDPLVRRTGSQCDCLRWRTQTLRICGVASYERTARRKLDRQCNLGLIAHQPAIPSRSRAVLP